MCCIIASGIGHLIGSPGSVVAVVEVTAASGFEAALLFVEERWQALEAIANATISAVD
jgi:hypothetical protein